MRSLEKKISKNEILVLEFDFQGNIIFANNSFCKKSGYSFDELLGKSYEFIRHSDVPNVIYKNLIDTLKSGKEWRGVLKNKTKDGGFYWCDTRIYPFVAYNKTQRFLSCRKRVSKEEIENTVNYFKNLKKEECGVI